MKKNTMSRTTMVLAATLFVTSAPSIAMAQEVGATPGNESVENYNGPSQTGNYPVEIYGQEGQHFGGVVAGNGSAGVAAGTINSSGQVHATEVGTQAPGEVCTYLPGTDIPYDCSH
jgi:hypothetical protein